MSHLSRAQALGRQPLPPWTRQGQGQSPRLSTPKAGQSPAHRGFGALARPLGPAGRFAIGKRLVMLTRFLPGMFVSQKKQTALTSRTRTKAASMRILQVANYYPSYGGVSALVEDLAASLRGDGHAVDLLSVGRKHRVSGTVSLARCVRSYDIIHCHATWKAGALPAYLVAAANMQRTPALLTYHGFHGYRHWFTDWLISAYQWTTTVDPLAREKFEQRFPRARVAHIRNLFDASRWTTETRETFRPRLVWLRGYRSPDLALRAFALVRRRHSDATLTLCGSAATADQWPDYAQEPGITFLGKVPREQLPEVLRQSDICLNTFPNDSFGYSVYEPMAMGLAVVSVESPVLRHEASDAVSFCDPESPGAMADAVCELVESPAVARARVAAGKLALRAVSWEVLRSRWYEIYRSMCAGGEDSQEIGTR